MPTLTERMRLYKQAVADGNPGTAAAIRQSALAQTPKPTPRATPQTGYPDWADLGEGDYAKMRSELDALKSQNRVLKGELQQASQRAYDTERRLAQSERRIAQLESENKL